jgi:hypothetical protein
MATLTDPFEYFRPIVFVQFHLLIPGPHAA